MIEMMCQLYVLLEEYKEIVFYKTLMIGCVND